MAESTTIQILKNMMLGLKSKVAEVQRLVLQQQDELDEKVTQIDIDREVGELDDTVDSWGDRITALESKVANVVLPESTRYYLDEQEITNLRSYIQQINVKMAEMQKSEQSMLALIARFNMTN